MQTVFGRKNKSAVSPVIGTILMVAITVVLAAVLYVMVAGLGPGNQNIPPTAVVSGGGSWAGGANNSTIYTFTVTTVTPAGAQVSKNDLTYIVSNSAQTTLYSGAAGTGTSGAFTIQVLYDDAVNDGRVTAGDKVQIIVTPSTGNPLVGGKFTINYNSAQFANGGM